MNKKREDNRIYLVAAAVCVLFFVWGILFIFHLQAANHGESLQLIHDSTQKEQSAIEQKIDGDLQILRGISISLSNMGMTDDEKIQQMLIEINNKNDFIRMGLASLDGKVNLVDADGSVYEQVSLYEQPIFQDALAGSETVSDTIPSVITGSYVNYYAVPVMENGAVTAVLCAVNSSDILSAIMTTAVFKGRGFYTIVDRQGTIVVSPQGGLTGGKYGVPLREIFDSGSAEIERFDEIVRSDSSETLFLNVNGERNCVVVQPMDGCDWIMVAVVPDSAIDEYFKQMAAGTTLIVVVSGLGLLLLMWHQKRVMVQNQTNLEFIAYTDVMTGMRNYTKFLIDAKHMIENNPDEEYVVWSIDVIQFKNINDIFGYQIGNQILMSISKFLQNMQIKQAIFCHISADYFAGITPDENKDDLLIFFENIIEAVASQQILPKDQMHISLAAGIYCMHDFSDKLPVEDMVNCAAIAKQEAKKSGQHKGVFFTKEMSESVRNENEIVANGKQALENQEICFFLQPKVSIQDGSCIDGAEVLARWKTPEHGWISPGEFVPAFEKNGMITQLDREIYRQACEWYQEYLGKGFDPINIAINVSRLGMIQEDFIDYYVRTRNQFGLFDAPIELEFTESIIINDYKRFAQIVMELQSHGFICSIDDFGAGYSSLNVLKNLPIDVLKLDAMFFRDVDSTRREEIIVEDVIHMVKKLGIRTIAEGVEEKTQVDFLRRVECDVIQGYVFSKPIPPEEFEALLTRTGGIFEITP